jgi:hypothetical protein
VVADRRAVGDPGDLANTARGIGAELVLADVASGEDPQRHDTVRLAAAYQSVMGGG